VVGLHCQAAAVLPPYLATGRDDPGERLFDSVAMSWDLAHQVSGGQGGINLVEHDTRLMPFYPRRHYTAGEPRRVVHVRASTRGWTMPNKTISQVPTDGSCRAPRSSRPR